MKRTQYNFIAPLDYHNGGEPFHTVYPPNVRWDAELMAQRKLSYPSIWNKLRREGRVYIQGSREGRSFIIVKRES